MNNDIVYPIKFVTPTFHIIFDAIGVDKELLDSDKFIFELIHEIPTLVGMKILSGPNMVRDHERPDNENPGISCFAIIDFSHISIHSFTKTKEILIDVFSCKKFDPQLIKRYLKKKLKINEKQFHCMIVKYPWEKGDETV